MIIKIDNRETSLIPLIEHRVEVFMNAHTHTGSHDLHEGIDDGIEDDGKVSVKKPKLKKSLLGNANANSNAANNGCLVPLHLFSNLEMNTEITTILPTHGNDEMGSGGGGSGSNKHIIKKEQLAIGDIILVDDDTGQNIIIFERKTLYDLAASIRDGRYNEQSFRLDKENIHNHSIVYIIEGDIERYVEKRGRVSKKTLISSMFSLLYYKGFSVFRTNSICETADVIVFFADKYYKTRISDKSRLPYYRENDCHKSEADVSASVSAPVLSLSPTTKGGDDSDDNEKYCAALKSHKEKNEYITPDNINIIMLTCVPGISSKVATQLMREYKTIQNLLYQLEKKPDMLNTFMIKTEGADTGAKTTFRKINKTSVENIKKFLMTNAACAVSSSSSGSGST